MVDHRLVLSCCMPSGCLRRFLPLRWMTDSILTTHFPLVFLLSRRSKAGLTFLSTTWVSSFLPLKWKTVTQILTAHCRLVFFLSLSGARQERLSVHYLVVFFSPSQVEDKVRNETAFGEVTIKVVDLTEEAVMQSGSFRVVGYSAHSLLQQQPVRRGLQDAGLRGGCRILRVMEVRMEV